jgi:ubiquinone/menaquinone biosynthesis C-methylase UbiE
VKKRDRMKALVEARRTLKPGGLLFVAAISRFASALDGMFHGYMKDAEFFKIAKRDLRTGQHRNPTKRPEYFTTAFFHAPKELEAEIRGVGFALVKLYGVEGAAWMLHDFDSVWRQPRLRARMLHVLHATENEPSLIGQSAHMVCVARKPR